MSGCLKAALIGGGIILVLGIIAVVVFVNWVGNRIEESGLGEAIANPEAPCSYISDAEASDVVGSEVTAQSGDSLMGIFLGMIRDTRLLPNAPSCFIGDDDGSVQIWISVHDGADAADVFAQSREVAQGQVVSESTTDEGGSLVVSTEPFMGRELSDLGDEAFCVDAGLPPFGGVLARRGDRVVFVSMLAGTEGDQSDVVGDALCQRAQPLARFLLG
ncbi:MAG TPA: hypothetical protein VIA81_00245 [Acidimicrobiia bacterium]|jgi:hypothetical protein